MWSFQPQTLHGYSDPLTRSGLETRRRQTGSSRVLDISRGQSATGRPQQRRSPLRRESRRRRSTAPYFRWNDARNTLRFRHADPRVRVIGLAGPCALGGDGRSSLRAAPRRPPGRARSIGRKRLRRTQHVPTEVAPAQQSDWRPSRGRAAVVPLPGFGISTDTCECGV